MIRRTWLWSFLALVVILAVKLPTPDAYAHGDAEWIERNSDYTDVWGRHCCGPDDCERVPPGALRHEGLDIIIEATRQVFRKGGRGTYQSTDSSWWWCKSRDLPWLRRELWPVKCLFFPFDNG